MIERLTGQLQPYAWGSRTFIPQLLGNEPTDEPQAELWLGAHHSLPSKIAGQSLATLVQQDPAEIVGPGAVAEFGTKLPYLLKVLAAAQPLSLQAHPSRAQAEAGYAREKAAGVAADAPHRIYKDDWPKPEMLCALVEAEALCGFRDPAETYALFAQLGVASAMDLVAPLADEQLEPKERISTVFAALLQLPEPQHDVISKVLGAAAVLIESETGGDTGRWAATALELGEHFPGDPSVLAALLLNRIQLHPGDAVYLPAGNLHAYLHGAGIEIMANSDNVLRGGLTPKHIDVDELMTFLDCTPKPPDLVRAVEVEPGLFHYPTPAPEFDLWKLELSGSPVQLPRGGGGRIVLATAGDLTVSGSAEIRLAQGQSAFVSASETAEVSGRGTAFVAAPGVG